MKIQLKIFEVIRWGPQGENDTIYLVSACSVNEAAELVDVYLRQMPVKGIKNFANRVCEIAPDPRIGTATIILGPCYQFAYAYGWKTWEREELNQEWMLQVGLEDEQ